LIHHAIWAFQPSKLLADDEELKGITLQKNSRICDDLRNMVNEQ
jgi:hypothetical protein